MGIDLVKKKWLRAQRGTVERALADTEEAMGTCGLEGGHLWEYN
jgi:hypothetical protein